MAIFLSIITEALNIFAFKHLQKREELAVDYDSLVETMKNGNKHLKYLYHEDEDLSWILKRFAIDVSSIRVEVDQQRSIYPTEVAEQKKESYVCSSQNAVCIIAMFMRSRSWRE